ncbi:MULTISPECIES: TolC family protein [Stutzerimonas stutzeri subgroup]|uniref:TolC family protein n=1 Tax=Stutzerimonas kunmingensis TaxID=1211807 RepID=UPI00241D9BE4|nr:TolC family protein [Stutzerimonas kunmingensis]
MNLRWLTGLAFAMSCGGIPFGLAAESLRLEEAVSRSLISNLSLAAEAADLRAVQIRAEREGLPTPYIVGGDLENFAGTGSSRGLQGAEATLRLGRVIELGGKRAARQALGTAEIMQQQHLSDNMRLEVASRTTARFIKVLADQHRLVLAREQVRLAERTRREVGNWVTAARNPESDLHAAEIALGEAELKREHAEHELGSAKVSLASSWSSFSPDFTRVEGNLHKLPPVAPFEALTALLPKTMAYRSSVFEAETISARRRLAEASAKPDIDLSLGVRRLEGLDDQGLVMSVSVPLGSKPRAALAIAEADEQLSALDSRREAQRAESHQALFGMYQELKHAHTEYEALRSRLLPKAEQAFGVARRGFESGRLSFASLAQAQRTLFELRERSVDVAARYHTLLVDVERLTAVSSEVTP